MVQPATQSFVRSGISNGTRTGDPEYDRSSAMPINHNKAMAISQSTKPLVRSPRKLPSFSTFF